MVKLAGSVQLDGQPVKSGTISFIPSDGKNPATGGTIADGHYQAQVPLGPMQISISSPQVTGVQKAYDTPDSPLLEISEEMIPAIYNANTTLEHTVSAAKDDLNFDLKSTP